MSEEDELSGRLLMMKREMKMLDLRLAALICDVATIERVLIIELENRMVGNDGE